MNSHDTVILIPEAQTRLFKQICIWRSVAVANAIKQTNQAQSPDLYARLKTEQDVLKVVLDQMVEII